MNNCPKCNEELVEGSVICPNCGEIVQNNDSVTSMEDELERFSKMIESLESNADINDTYTVDDLEKQQSTDSEEITEEAVEIEVIVPEIVEIEHELIEVVDEVVEESNQVVPLKFSKSKNGVKKIEDEESVEKLETEESDNEAIAEISDEQEEIEVISEEIIEDKEAEQEVDTIENAEFLDVSEVDVETPDTSIELEIDDIQETVVTIEDDDNNSVENIDELDLELDLDDIDRFSKLNTLTQTNTLEEMLKKNVQIENIEKNVVEFFDEIEHFGETHENLDENKALSKDTYLKLNFVTTDKFATLISSDNERQDSQSDAELLDSKMQFTDILDLGAIISAETLSEEELNSTIQAVNIQKDELKITLEEVEKAHTVSIYRDMRKKMIESLKIFGVIFMFIVSFLLLSYIYEFGLFDVGSKLYSNNSIEKYDYIIYNSMLTMVEDGYAVRDAFELYQAGEISKDEMIKICDENTLDINGHKEIFEKHVYEEANEYIFKADTIYFFAGYYIDNIRDYVLTGNKYYLDLNRQADLQVDQMIEEIYNSRVEFLKEFDYTDEQIKILDFKIENSSHDEFKDSHK